MARTAESSDGNVCKVSASSTASEGNYTVVVSKLAQAYRAASSAVASGTRWWLPEAAISASRWEAATR